MKFDDQCLMLAQRPIRISPKPQQLKDILIGINDEGVRGSRHLPSEHKHNPHIRSTHMVYITYNCPERFREMTFEELLRGDFNLANLSTGGHGATRTVICNKVPPRIMRITKVEQMILQLQAFNQQYESLRLTTPRSSLYNHFPIPKASGGLRWIDAPNSDLMKALKELKTLFQSWMFADHHTCAFAYVEDRSVLSAAKRHQKFGAWWFAHFDFHGFFPSTTPEFVLSQFELIYPFNLILASPTGHAELIKALDLCFLNGALPQGTPISPLITNIMMIPFDHAFAKAVNHFESGKHNPDGTPITDRLCYTRYADDIIVSCKVIFNFHAVERLIVQLLSQMNAPFTLNETKTQFHSRAGRNWILGVMLNKDNQITVGYRKNKIFKATIDTYFRDKQKGKKWPDEDLQSFQGNITWFKDVQPDTTKYIIQKYNAKYGLDLESCIKADLAPLNVTA